jgi:hypothetical protein
MPGLTDFVTLCNVVILFNVLDSRTYGTPDQTEDDSLRIKRHDCNTISDDDRRKFVYARGMSLELLRWVATKFVVFDDYSREEYSMQEWQDIHMTQLGLYMLQYLEHWIKEESQTDNPQLPAIDVDSLKKQLDWAIYTVPWIAEDWTEEKMHYTLHVQYPPSFRSVRLDGTNLTHMRRCKLFCFFIIHVYF